MGLNSFDVIVIGGGPAGSMTAYSLAKAGVRTALFDAASFPRCKPCGGGLQARTFKEIPFDLSHLFRGVMDRITLTFGLSNACTREYGQPLVYNVLRSEFDSYLLEQAIQSGAHVMQRSLVRSIEAAEPGQPVSVRTDAGEFRAHCLVGADGANSIVRPHISSRHDYFWQAAVYCEVPEEEVNPEALRGDCMSIDWGTLPSGYAWAFPKRGSVNIGAGGPISLARHLKRYAGRFAESIRLLRRGALDRLQFVGHQLPTLTRNARVVRGPVLLAGDAAGVVEPFTGDGISFACQSARIAAQCIFEALDSGRLDFSEYSTRLKAAMGNELLWSRKLVSISAAFPRLIYRLFKSNDYVWQTFCKTVRGEETFHRLKRDVLGPFEIGWKLIDRFTELRERAVLSPHSLGNHIRVALGD